MRKTLVSLCAATALLFTGTAVQAQSIPWGYSATDYVTYSGPIKTSSITFQGRSGAPNGDSGIIIYNLTTQYNGDGTADAFSNAPFHLDISLTDIAAIKDLSPSAKQTDKVTFDGKLNATKVTAQSLLPGAVTWDSPTSAFVVLGSNDPSIGWRKYTVDITSFTMPGEPGGAPGSVQAVVHITPTDGQGTGGGPPPTAPEPTSLVLAGLALPALLMARRRLKKAQQA